MPTPQDWIIYFLEVPNGIESTIAATWLTSIPIACCYFLVKSGNSINTIQ
ncbi:hypothetical protein [Nostoc sp.]|nr:hypothetical protein [Nostoc sp.]